MIQLLLLFLSSHNRQRVFYITFLLACPFQNVLASTFHDAHTLSSDVISKFSQESTRDSPEANYSRAQAPEITVDGSGMETFSTPTNEESVQIYLVTFEFLAPGQAASISIEDNTGNFTISEDGVTFGKTLALTANIHGELQTSVIIKYLPKQGSEHAALISHSTAGAITQTLAITGNVISPLPIRLLAFHASTQQNHVLLQWRAAADAELSHFEVEASNGTLAEFKSEGTIQYNGKSESYSFIFNPENKGPVHYFRLVQKYHNHPPLRSHIITVKTNPIVTLKTAVLPNPLTSSSRLVVEAPLPGQIEILLHNGSGVEIFRKVYEVMGGENTFNLAIFGQLERGLYFLTTTQHGNVNRLKLLKL